MPSSAKMAALGFMIFGCGVEMAGITVSKGIVKWFKGKEMALAMGLEMAIARIGVAAAVLISPAIANMGGVKDVSRLFYSVSSYCSSVLLLSVSILSWTKNWKNKWEKVEKNRKNPSKSRTRD